MESTKTAAFFDFDKTLIELDSGTLGLKWLKDHGMLPLVYILKMLFVKALYDRHLASEEQMAKTAITFYKKRRLDDFAKDAGDFYNLYLKPHLAPNIVRRVQEHKKSGHVLILISGSVRYWLRPAVADMGFDHLLCTDLEEDEKGLLTGRAKDLICVGHNKRTLALELAEREKIDLKNSYAYGNHQADVPLLELVGNPHAVEPTEPLRKISTDRSWPILTFK